MSDSRATLRDVARLAKVSSATVSRVANGNPQVDPEIQSAVYAAAKELGIDLTDTRKNRTIAFVLGNRDRVNEFQSRILLGAEGYCAQHNWDLQFVSFRGDLSAPPANLLLPEALTRPIRSVSFPRFEKNEFHFQWLETISWAIGALRSLTVSPPMMCADLRR